MPKARISKEKSPVESDLVAEASAEPRPRRRRARTPDEEPRAPAPDDGPAAEESAAPLRPVLTAISRPVRDDDLHGPDAEDSPALAALRPAASPLLEEKPAPATVLGPDGTPMQVLRLNDLKRMKIAELAKMAHDAGIDGTQGLKKQELIFALLSGITDKKFEVHAEGVLELLSDGFGFLRSADSDYQPSPDDIYVSPSQVRRFALRPGDTITGSIRQPREGERFFALQKVERVNFVDPTSTEARERILFDNLTPLYPTRKLMLEHDGSEMTTRIIDLFDPIGFGQRGLIVAPPRTGKTVLLHNMANAISTNSPEACLIILLVDERPEEVTDFRRHTRGEVVSSTFDETPRATPTRRRWSSRRPAGSSSMGQHVVILLDSITRLARAYNALASNSGKIMTGGMEATALQKPKRFFGSARNIEGGGSLTIMGTALIDTGSKMDEVIFEEFKGTGNMELHLDRDLVNKRIFPCLDIDKPARAKRSCSSSPRTWCG